MWNTGNKIEGMESIEDGSRSVEDLSSPGTARSTQDSETMTGERVLHSMFVERGRYDMHSRLLPMNLTGRARAGSLGRHDDPALLLHGCNTAMIAWSAEERWELAYPIVPPLPADGHDDTWQN
ncbi:hypothetical protein J1614_012239 [Plenodomus biglobosus]|nr:hypothetical protein J1614_012239 [Plenodomus biglobosus]